MSIPASQLESWSKQGATELSATTHTSLKAALNAHVWPSGMTFTTYLQGSYANATNIRGNSDVDLVVETAAVHYSNLTEEEKAARRLAKGAFNFRDFQREVFGALTRYYGSALVRQGDKSIKIAAASGRLAADVVPAVEYREYKDGDLYGTGITFWTTTANEQVKNFPKHHIENGARKNEAARTNGWCKPSVRMFKNARERIIGSDPEMRKKFPSYFVECLIFNAADSSFGTTFGHTYQRVVSELLGRLNRGEGSQLVCQNYKRFLFGNTSVQWNERHAGEFLAALEALWRSY